MAGRIAATRAPVRILDLERAEIVGPILRENGLSSLLGVPLLVEGDVIGVRHLGTLHQRVRRRGRELLQRAADRAALATCSR